MLGLGLLFFFLWINPCFATAVDRVHLSPVYRHEELLRQVLKAYQQKMIQGSWPVLPAGPTLRPGATDTSIVLLRKRLEATGDLLPSEPTESRTFFDDTLARAVRRFQKRHGLIADGIVGPTTRAALQVSIQDRIHQLSLNLARWRELPRDLGHRYIWMNIPAFTLDVVENDQVVMTMRAVVGKPSWPTPVLRAQLIAVVLNPTWHIPPRIVQQEIIPQLQRDPTYLSTHHIVVIQGRGDQATEIAPETVDWAKASLQGIPYRFRQQPGPTNPLGRVKFTMPNPFHITLHDTPSRLLFAHNMRAYSHGCVRLERPIDLATYLLREDRRWTRAAILDTIHRGIQQQVAVPTPIPVYLNYHTAWVDREGVVHFRPDIYAWDTPSRVTPERGQVAACGS